MRVPGGGPNVDPAPARAVSGLRLLVADNAPTRLGIRMALADTLTICAEAGSGELAIRAAMREQPDVCLVGREMLGSGLGLLRGICRSAPDCAVVVLAAEQVAEDMLEAFRAGAIGYVPGALSAERLQLVMRAVAHHEAIVPRSMTLDLLAALRDEGTESSLLTIREAEVLKMLRRGHTTSAIAARLQIAPVTVRRHISELVSKLGVADRFALISSGPPPRYQPPPARRNGQ
ncbi:MAG: response regulator transcription factor [Solirubrobacterales bacterium]|nr:response regulator transcription factor [Solirubrobacterales bacterium]